MPPAGACARSHDGAPELAQPPIKSPASSFSAALRQNPPAKLLCAGSSLTGDGACVSSSPTDDGSAARSRRPRGARRRMHHRSRDSWSGFGVGTGSRSSPHRRRSDLLVLARPLPLPPFLPFPRRPLPLPSFLPWTSEAGHGAKYSHTRAPRGIPSAVASRRRGRTTGARSSARPGRTGRLRRLARRRGSRRWEVAGFFLKNVGSPTAALFA
jgi:hypothetical protein